MNQIIYVLKLSPHNEDYIDSYAIDQNGLIKIAYRYVEKYFYCKCDSYTISEKELTVFYGGEKDMGGSMMFYIDEFKPVT